MEENPENLKKLIPRSLNFRGQSLILSARQGKRAGEMAPIQIQAQGLLKVLLLAKDVNFDHEEMAPIQTQAQGLLKVL